MTSAPPATLYPRRYACYPRTGHPGFASEPCPVGCVQFTAQTGVVSSVVRVNTQTTPLVPNPS